MRRAWPCLFLFACGPGAIGDDEPMVERPPPPVVVDADGDGLGDAWELWAGDPSRLDPTNADTDGDGISDADEDEDQDGLTNLQEFAASRLDPKPTGAPPHPFVRSVLVEFDRMEDRTVDEDVFNRAADAYAAVDIGVHFFVDETDIEPVDFDGSFAQRHNVFDTHGPRFAAQSIEDVPTDRMIHMIVAAQRTDIALRGGEVVTHEDDEPDRSGVFIYYDVLERIHPNCGRPEGGPIQLADALTGTIVHELGHALQLGHDTDRGGGINHFNIMSVATSCDEALMRFEGIGNDDETLGSTANVAEPRFSAAAARLIDFDRQLSVDTGVLIDDVGREM